MTAILLFLFIFFQNNNTILDNVDINSTIIINNVVDLENRVINLPENTTILYEGGGIINGTLNLSVNTIIDCILLNNTLILTGENASCISGTVNLAKLPPPYARGDGIKYGRAAHNVGLTYQDGPPDYTVHYTGDAKTPETPMWYGKLFIYGNNNDTIYLLNENFNPDYPNSKPDRWRKEMWTYCVIDSMYMFIKKDYQFDNITGEWVDGPSCNCEYTTRTDTIYFQYYNN
jgi:hypothetical protein